MVTTPRLVHDVGLVEPDLSGLDTAVADIAPGSGEPVLALTPVHPHATGVTVTDGARTWRVDTLPAVLAVTGDPGRHHLTVAATTAYATLHPHPVTYHRS